MRMKREFQWTWIVAVFCAIEFACGVARPARLDQVSGAIVGGQKTSDWPAVGALVVDVPGYGYMGPYCSGTLIAPQWVLTAAHCVSSYQGMPILPGFVKFYIGTNANAAWGGVPATGTLVPADEFFPHPQYDSSLMTVGHDIGLVRLKQPVSGVSPVPINVRPLRGAHLGSEVLFVGFGVSDGIQQTGSGVKRETTIPMTWFDDGVFYTEPHGSGTCQGDSGGPGLLQMDASGTWFQVGVVSAGSESPGVSGDPCLTGVGIYTRVDAHVRWIAEVTGLTFGSCAHDVCLCDEACGPEGGCDDSVCRTWTCLDALGCDSGCTDAACRMECRLLTRPEDAVAYDKVSYCLQTKCNGMADLLGCATASCGSSLSGCAEVSGASRPCAAYARCRAGCAQQNALCLYACEAGASEQARGEWDALSACLEQSGCALPPGTDPWVEPCARAACEAELDACDPPPPCNPLGGTCEPGSACRVSAQGDARCVPSGGLAETEPCDPAAEAPCADGLQCDAVDGRCRRACLEDADCADASRCVRPDRAAAPGVCRPVEPPDEAGGEVPDAEASAVDGAAEAPAPDVQHTGDAGVSTGSSAGCVAGRSSGVAAPFGMLGLGFWLLQRRFRKHRV